MKCISLHVDFYYVYDVQTYIICKNLNLLCNTITSCVPVSNVRTVCVKYQAVEVGSVHLSNLSAQQKELARDSTDAFYLHTYIHSLVHYYTTGLSLKVFNSCLFLLQLHWN